MPAPKYFVGRVPLHAYCDREGIKYQTIVTRIHSGYTVKQALKKPMISFDLADLPGEERVEVRGYEGYYDISSHGRLRTYRKPRKGGCDLCSEPTRILKGWKKKQTTIYNCHTLYTEFDRKRHYKTARLVAVAFHGLDYRDKYTLVCHKDDDGMHNHKDNIFLGSHSDNTQDSIRKGRCKLKYFTK